MRVRVYAEGPHGSCSEYIGVGEWFYPGLHSAKPTGPLGAALEERVEPGGLLSCKEEQPFPDPPHPVPQCC